MFDLIGILLKGGLAMAPLILYTRVVLALDSARQAVSATQAAAVKPKESRP